MIDKVKPFKIHDYKPLPGYPNAYRSSLMFWDCQKCEAHKLDIDLYPDTGLCGTCQSEEWAIKRKLTAIRKEKKTIV